MRHAGGKLHSLTVVLACLIGAVSSSDAVAGQAGKGARTSRPAPTPRDCKVEGQQVTRQGKVYQCVRGSDGQMAYQLKDVLVTSAVGSTGGAGVAEGQACTTAGKRVTVKGKAYQCVNGVWDDTDIVHARATPRSQGTSSGNSGASQRVASEGTACPTLGQRTTSGGRQLTCVSKWGKQVWSFGMPALDAAGKDGVRK